MIMIEDYLYLIYKNLCLRELVVNQLTLWGYSKIYFITYILLKNYIYTPYFKDCPWH